MRLLATIAFVLLFASTAYADSIYGSCRTTSGEKCMKSNHTISTSWNSKKGYPNSRGNYEIDFGKSVGQRITVYCDGSKVGTVRVHGRTRFDVVCR